MEVTPDDLARLLELTKGVLAPEAYHLLEKVLASFVYMTSLIEKSGASIKELRRLLFGMKSEKLSKILDDPEAGKSPPATESSEEGKTEAPAEGSGKGDPPPGGEEGGDGGPAKTRKGHGRKGADAYEGAEKVSVAHETLQPGDPCPEAGCRGKVYELMHPSVLVRIVGRSPLGAKVIELEQLRCNLCLKVFTAKAPEDVGREKYDETAASMIALLRYGTGVPFNRLEGLQANFGIPLPASTQWDVVEAAYKKIAPAHGELMCEAAQGDVLHNDDTPMKILELMKKRKKKETTDDG